MSKFTLPTLLATALLATIGLPAPVSAQEAVPDVHVAWRDLDLGNPAGVAELDRRIDRAIKEVCPDHWASDFRRRNKIAKCHATKRAQVESQRAAAIAAARPARAAVTAAR